MFDRKSIKTQILLLVSSTTVIAVACAFGTFVMKNFTSAREARVQQISAVADVVANNSRVALSFGEDKSAEELLNSLKAQPTIKAAVIVDQNHQPFAKYGDVKLVESEFNSGSIDGGWHAHRKETLLLFVPIEEFDETIGGLYIAADTSDVWNNAWHYATDTLMVIIVVLAFVICISFVFQKSITNPILRLTKTAQSISKNNDYSIRFDDSIGGEVGVLGRHFDLMLDQIESKNRELTEVHDELLEANTNLEKRVEDRTQELKDAYEQLVEENEKRQQAYSELQETQNQLVESSRAAGMADIATGVLHNIGNVLNSINVASQSAAEEITDFKFDTLEKMVDMINDKKGELGDEWISFPKFQALPNMLETLSNSYRTGQEHAMRELDGLKENVEFVKDIVKSQQEVALKGNMVTTTRCSDLFRYSLKLLSSKISEDIKIIKTFEVDDEFEVDKNKLLQILTNFIKNAIEAMESYDESENVIELISCSPKPGWISLKVRDTGFGISEENLKKMFSFGFTTKQTGHGFGLHSAACAAKEMNGEVTVHSDGPGKGACFGIDLPMKIEAPKCEELEHQIMV